jgi:ketosteroid isomerase-like protein
VGAKSGEEKGQGSTIVEGFLAALGQKNMQKVMSLLARDATMAIHTALPRPYGGTFTGAEDIAKGFRDRNMEFAPDSSLFEMTDMVEAEHRVIILLTPRMQSTHRETYNNCSVIFELRSGQIASMKVYVET